MNTLSTLMTRRRFLGVCGTGALSAALPLSAQNSPATTSKLASVAEAFDREVKPFMVARNVPGGALAVVKDRRLVYAKGYGWADREKKIPVKADSLFRIASVSKPITAVAVMRLVEQKKLNLDARAFDIVK